MSSQPAKPNRPRQSRARREKTESIAYVIPAHVYVLIGQRPLTPWQKAEDYDHLLSRLAVEENPTSIVDWQIIIMMVNCWWQSNYYRIVKACLIKLGMHSIGQSIVYPTLMIRKSLAPYDAKAAADDLIQQAEEGDAESIRLLEELLKEQGFSLDSLTARSFEDRFDTHERLDRLIFNFDRQFQEHVQQLDRRRLALGTRLPKIADQVVTDIDETATV